MLKLPGHRSLMQRCLDFRARFTLSDDIRIVSIFMVVLTASGFRC